MSHSHLDFKNGLMIKANEENEDYVVGFSQYGLVVPPGEYRGIFVKPYTGFERGE